MMLGLVLLYVGAVLFLNAVWLLGKISGREVAVINFLVGVLSACVAFYLIFSQQPGRLAEGRSANPAIRFTYLWVAANQFLEVDGKGLGWFCLFVSLTACTVAIESFAGASGPFGLWNAVNWTVWALLWFCFFLLLGLSRSIQKPVAYLTLASAIFTAWLPGLLLLGQVLKA